MIWLDLFFTLLMWLASMVAMAVFYTARHSRFKDWYRNERVVSTVSLVLVLGGIVTSARLGTLIYMVTR